MNPAPIKGETSFTLKASAMISTAVPRALNTPRVSPKMKTKITYDLFQKIDQIAYLNGSL